MDDRHFVLNQGKIEEVERVVRLLRKAGTRVSQVREYARPYGIWDGERTPRQAEQIALYDALGATLSTLAGLRSMLSSVAAEHTRLVEGAYARATRATWDQQLDENRKRNLEDYGEARPDFPE